MDFQIDSLEVLCQVRVRETTPPNGRRRSDPRLSRHPSKGVPAQEKLRPLLVRFRLSRLRSCSGNEEGFPG
jgi:hypothetical protein